MTEKNLLEEQFSSVNEGENFVTKFSNRRSHCEIVILSRIDAVLSCGFNGLSH